MATMKKAKFTFWQIWNMAFGFLGIQFGWGLQMGNMSAIYEYLGAEPHQIPLLWLAAPLTGLIVQPIVGYLSDNTWSPRFGRRKPYFFIGALLASLLLVAMPYSSSIWMAAGLLWILDASINISMEPFRAFVADVLPKEQYTRGYTMQSFFIGIGAVMSAALPWFFLDVLNMNDAVEIGVIPDYVKYSFFIGAFAFITAVLYTILTTKEYPPGYYQDEEDEEEKLSYSAGLSKAFRNMPDAYVKLAPVQFFTWMGLFLMWFYFTVTITGTVFGADDPTDPAYADGVVWGNICFGFYSLVTFVFALFMPKISEKLGLSRLHAFCLLMGGIGLISVAFITNKWLLLLSMGGVGIAWASIVSMPYAMIAKDIPPKQMGIFMGLFNMFIVTPEIIASLGFGWIMQNVFNNVKLYGVVTAGVLLLIASALTLRVKST